ncbi:MAG TPA: ABC transporter substrate-binding protein [Usitatibacter sp.]|nr:ABC transporter substrate-binding protein [Usitatibacter sp.]
MPRFAALALAALIAAAPLVQAKTLRWSSQGDYLTADPMAQNELLTNSINGQVYESLVMRGKKLEILPGLAESWEQKDPKTWIFHLRKGVKWQDGSDFTADDVVFSIKRLQGPTSNFRVYGNAVGAPTKIDEYTVQLVTPVPNPVMLEMLANSLFMMSKKWCEEHNALETQDFKKQEESYTSRHAMGTGPYILVSREPDVKSVFKKNPNWWGLKAGKDYWDGNVDDIVYSPVKSGATRISALLSGDLDFVLDPDVQDIDKLKHDKNIHVYEGRENRVIFLEMDQNRGELLYSNVKGKNPFKDIRVRKAFLQAINIEAIHRAVMRGLSVPTAINLPNPEKAGIPKSLDKRLPYDVAAAKKLMAEAGYPNGFEVRLDCPNNRYINDEKICVAVAGMLAKIGVTVKVNAMPRAQYFPMVQRLDTSFCMLGWGGATTDAIFTLQPVLHSRDAQGDGDFNWGNYKDPKFDAMIDDLKGDTDPKRRQEKIDKAMEYFRDQVYNLPLHIQVIPWASRANVKVIHRADNWLQATWVQIQ